MCGGTIAGQNNLIVVVFEVALGRTGNTNLYSDTQRKFSVLALLMMEENDENDAASCSACWAMKDSACVCSRACVPIQIEDAGREKKQIKTSSD